MKHLINRMWTEDDGVLSFEWILLVTLLTIGLVSGITAARDAIIDEFGDVAQAMLALDQTYCIDFPLNVVVHTNSTLSSSSNSEFEDSAKFFDCDRITTKVGQGKFVDMEM